jgi:tellurite resistance protein TerC
MESLFPFAEYWWIYASFLGLIAVVLAIDLGVFNKTPHQPSLKEAGLWTVAWVALAGLFNLALYFYSLQKFGSAEIANRVGLEFLAGYVVEKTLAVDNIFVFAMVFAYFKVPLRFQHKVLFWGIIGALLFRGLFIALGAFLMQYHFVVVGFGVLLVLTGLKMAFQKDEGDMNDRWVLRLLRRWLPLTSDDDRGSFVRTINGKRFVTPLFLALVVIEVSDIIFAVDSVPAIFALTKEPLTVFTSNIMAILGLRSMYFMISGFMDKFTYIKYGLAAVLVFVGFKMSYLNGAFGGKFPITWSLAVITVLVGTSIVASLVKTRRGAARVRIAAR